MIFLLHNVFTFNDRLHSDATRSSAQLGSGCVRVFFFLQIDAGSHKDHRDSKQQELKQALERKRAKEKGLLHRKLISSSNSLHFLCSFRMRDHFDACSRLDVCLVTSSLNASRTR